MTQFKLHLTQIQSNLIHSNKFLHQNSRTDANGYRRPAIFNYLIQKQNKSIVDRTAEYLSPEILEILIQLFKFWDDFFKIYIKKLNNLKDSVANSSAKQQNLSTPANNHTSKNPPILPNRHSYMCRTNTSSNFLSVNLKFENTSHRTTGNNPDKPLIKSKSANFDNENTELEDIKKFIFGFSCKIKNASKKLE